MRSSTSRCFSSTSSSSFALAEPVCLVLTATGESSVAYASAAAAASSQQLKPKAQRCAQDSSSQESLLELGGEAGETAEIAGRSDSGRVEGGVEAGWGGSGEVSILPSLPILGGEVCANAHVAVAGADGGEECERGGRGRPDVQWAGEEGDGGGEGGNSEGDGSGGAEGGWPSRPWSPCQFLV